MFNKLKNKNMGHKWKNNFRMCMSLENVMLIEIQIKRTNVKTPLVKFKLDASFLEQGLLTTRLIDLHNSNILTHNNL